MFDDSSILKVPEGSKIEVVSNSYEVEVILPKKNGGVMGAFIKIFLGIWLVGWFIGLCFVIGVLLFQEDVEQKGFLLFWLTGWSIGGAAALWFFWKLMKPSVREKIVLSKERFFYTTGSPSLMFLSPFGAFKDMGRAMKSQLEFFLNKIKEYEFEKSQTPEFVLEGFSSEQRLRFDKGAERVEIGIELSEPEREWLARVLKTWNGQSQDEK